MIYPSILTQTFCAKRPFIDEVARRAKDTLVTFCEQRGYAFISRVKTVESIAEKIETGRFGAWSELDDLFACTIIVPTLRHEEEAITFCAATFQTTTIVRRGETQKAPEEFRFDSTRIKAKLRKPEGLEAARASIYDVIFEIQIKSAFEHAWAVTTHDLAYKSAEVDWKRQRLAAQLKAIVEQLDMLILGYEQTMEKIGESPYFELERKRYISQKMVALFKDGIIPSELAPKDFSRFCNNVYSLLQGIGKADKTEETIAIVDKLIRETPQDLIPRSVSLFQYVFAILTKAKEIKKQPGKGFICHITEELETLFPEIKDLRLQQVFKYDK